MADGPKHRMASAYIDLGSDPATILDLRDNSRLRRRMDRFSV